MKRTRLAGILALALALVGGRVASAQEHDTAPGRPGSHAAPPHPEAVRTPPTPYNEEHAGPAPHGGDHVAPAGHDDAHASSAAHEGGHHGPEDINWTDFGNKKKPAFLALLLNFGLLVGLYYTLGKKPIAEGLKQRRVTIGKDIEEAQKLLDEAKERAKKYQADLKNADADAETARAGLVSAGKGEVDRLLKDARERSERMKRDAERLVDQERKQLRQDLVAETVELAVAEARVILSKTVTPEDHARLANDLLAELAGRPAAGKTLGGMS